MSQFHKDKSTRDGYRPYCKVCIKAYHKKNSSAFRKHRKEYRTRNKEQIRISRKINYRAKPWKHILQGIKQRCNNPKATGYQNYGGRGIKCLITEKEIKDLWYRDRAYLMNKPSIDRIDNDSSYYWRNCRFIELSKNISIQPRQSCCRRVLQYNLDKKLIRKWKSLKQIEESLGIPHANIIKCLNGLRNQAGGFIWKDNKNEQF